MSDTTNQHNPDVTTVISELLHKLEQKSLSTQDTSELTDPTNLWTPVSDKDIYELRARLGDLRKFGGSRGLQPLPPDYTAFLKTSNGFSLHERGAQALSKEEAVDLSTMLYGVSHVQREDWCIDFDLFKANPILHPLPDDVCNKFMWPQVRVPDLGASGDEGNLWLFGPSELGLARAEIHRVYPELCEAHKAIVDKLVQSTYGSWQALSEQQWTVLEFYHWSPDLKLHLGFRDYLQSLIDEENDTGD